LIIFLDIDGVLKTDWNKVKWNNNCISILNKIYHNIPNIEYVITSTWRITRTVKELQDILISNGIVGNIKGFTPVLCEDRGIEISEYIKQNDISNFIVIDDKIEDIIDYIDNDKIYCCDFIKGLTSYIGDSIIRKFI
jgi:hypothetical protein